MLKTMIKRIAPIAALALGTTLAGCGDMDIKIGDNDGVPLAELDMSGAAPTEIAVAGPDAVFLTVGETLDITVEGDDDAVNALRFVNEDGMLGISRESENWGGTGTAIVRVTMPAPSDIVIGGSGDVETETMAEDATIVIGGSGDVAVDQITAQSLDVLIGGSGSVSAKGTVDRLEMTIGGNGNGKFSELTADDVQINIGGSGDVSLRSNGTVEANIGGSGTVNVVGDATCTLNSLGSGELNCSPESETASAEG